MNSIVSDILIEQWERQEESDRERIEEEAADKWACDIEPEERETHLQMAEEAWELDIEPEQRERYIADALDAWDAEADDRRDAYLEAASA